MTTHRISRGFDIRMAGKPEARLAELADAERVAVCPPDFPGTQTPGMKAKLCVAEGADVQTGEPLFFDKNDPETKFCSPGTGVVEQIVLGERRALLAVVIRLAGSDQFHSGPRLFEDRLDGTDYDDITGSLKGAGLWPLLRQRPLARVARSDTRPSAIYVNGMDTEPLAADPAFAVQGHGEDLQRGLRLLARLTEGKVYLTVRDGAACKEFEGLDRVDLHRFSGPHPAGLVGTHIQEIAPLKDGQTAWYLKAQDAVLLGEWLRTGHYPAHRVVAVGGTQAPERRYVRVRQGSPIAHVLGGAMPTVRCGPWWAGATPVLGDLTARSRGWGGSPDRPSNRLSMLPRLSLGFQAMT